MSRLIPASALFRFRVRCRPIDVSWEKVVSVELSEVHRLPFFGELQGATAFADVRMAWTEEALIWQVEVAGKQQEYWSRSTHPDASDGLQVFLDTRDVKQVQRGTQFCHRLVFPLPPPRQRVRKGISGSREIEPVQLDLEGARGQPARIAPSDMLGIASLRPDGYRLTAAVRATALTGLDQTAGARLGFFYIVRDREFGAQYWSLSDEYTRLADDPSLWGTVDLVPETDEGGHPRR